MLIVLDTSALVRFFTNDIPEKAKKVEKLLSQKELFVPDVVFPELEYVLKKGYRSSREEILTAYHYLLGKNNVSISTTLTEAVEIYEKSKLDMSDCIIAAYSLKGKLASFDKKLLEVEEVKPVWES